MRGEQLESIWLRADYDNAGGILENIMLILPLPEFLTDV